jgi:hypothetical protein
MAMAIFWAISSGYPGTDIGFREIWEDGNNYTVTNVFPLGRILLIYILEVFFKQE